MSSYSPPVSEMIFALYDALGFSHEDLDRETGEAILDEAAKLASDVLAPLNKAGDEIGAVLDNGAVKTAEGFKDAYQTYCEGGWNSVPFSPEYGGQGLPWAIAFPVQEMWQGANMSFGLCPLLNQGAIEAIATHGSDQQKSTYLPKLISGEWTGTMNLTEAQAGSDLGLLRSKAEKKSDGTYEISGQKIFITYGEHDMAENIIHLVLARTVDAPEDVKGISLFIVPKILDDGTRNAVACIGLEHKLGIHSSPTCTMEFDGATGYLVGGEHMGLKYMFTMMNNARLCVGLQGVAIAQAAYQHALSYAEERVQGKSFETGQRVTISQHADVRRMLLDMKARITAGRLMAYGAAIELDRELAGDVDARARVAFLTPIVKGWCTDMAVHVTSEAIQVWGGMGFIEESGAAQFYRDARILPIYEGTNGIQAADFVFRKIAIDGGKVAFSFIDEMKGAVDDVILSDLKEATDKLLSLASQKKRDDLAWLSTPYLSAFSSVYGYFLLEMASKIANSEDQGIADVCGFYASSILPLCQAHLQEILKYG
ncbi:MAG: acyl-CoA dehydrogenase [Alphaproteobacteria bacterium]